MYDLVGSQFRRSSTPRSWTSGSSTRPGQSTSPTRSRRAFDSRTSRWRSSAYRQMALESREPVVKDEVTMPGRSRLSPPVIAGEPADRGVRPPRRRRSRDGVISLQNIDRARVQRRRRRLLTTLAGASPSRSRTPGCSRRRQRNAELALISDVQRGLAENLDMQSMYELVGDRIQEIFDAQVVDIGIVDREANQIHYPYTIERARVSGSGSYRPRTRFPCAGDPRTAADQRADREHVVERRRDHPGAPRSLQSGSRSWSAVQRRASSLQNIDREHAFSEADVRLLTTLAGQPLRCARERPALRGGEAEQRGTRTHHRRPAGLARNLDMQSMYELVGDRIQRSSTRRSSTSGSWTGRTDSCTSRTRSRRANASPTSRDRSPGSAVT